MVVIGEVKSDGYWMEFKRLDSGIYDEDWKRERETKGRRRGPRRNGIVRKGGMGAQH